MDLVASPADDCLDGSDGCTSYVKLETTDEEFTREDGATSEHEHIDVSSLCINCRVNTAGLKSYTLNEVYGPIRSVIEKWVSPLQFSDNSLLCLACLVVAKKARIDCSQQKRQFGHCHVCVKCGCSLVSPCRSYTLQSDAGGTESLIRNIIAVCVLPYQLTSTDVICHPCWLEARQTLSGFSKPSTSKTAHIKTNLNTEATIYLPNYTRVQTLTDRYCFYPKYKGKERMRVPLIIRRQLLYDFNYYVPPTSRTCNYHATRTSGDILTNVENPKHLFNAEQIEDLVGLLKRSDVNTIDFKNIENVDNAIFHYCFGLTHDEVTEIVKEVPRIDRMHRGRLALLAYLMKLRTGDTDVNISSLLKISTSSFKRLIDKVKEILKNADLAKISTKKVIQKLEKQFGVDLSKKKKVIDQLVMDFVNNKGSDEEVDAEEEEEEEEEKKPPKRSAPAAKGAAKKARKDSSEEEEDGTNDSESEEEKKKPAPKKSKKKKGSDADSDSDWGKKKEKAPKTKKGAGRGKGGGYTRAYKLSPALAELMGQEEMPRHEVVKRVWTIIKEKKLYDPNNKQFAICDDALYKVFGTKRFRTFGMMKYLKTHFLDE